MVCHSKLVNVVSCSSWKCFGSAVVPPVDCGAVLNSGNKLYVYADDSTFVAVVRSLGERVAVTESLNRYLNSVNMS